MQPLKFKRPLSLLGDNAHWLVRARAKALEEHPIDGNWDMAHLAAVHGFLYKDVLPDAGTFRDEVAQGSDHDNAHAAIQRDIDGDVPTSYPVVHEHRDRMRGQMVEALDKLHILHTVLHAPVALPLGELLKTQVDMSFARPFTAGNATTITAFTGMATGLAITGNRERHAPQERVAMDAAVNRRAMDTLPLHEQDRQALKQMNLQYGKPLSWWQEKTTTPSAAQVKTPSAELVRPRQVAQKVR